MPQLDKAVAVLGRPYNITKSRLGAITKVFNDQYVCDLDALRVLVQSIGEKLSSLESTSAPSFSFLISFSDKTHQDGAIADLQNLECLPIGKQTDRVVMNWTIPHRINGEENELSLTVRISNPINPLIFLQAALSKSPTEVDNIEFEMGATCVTVDGAGQAYSDEIFLRIQNWIDARNKPHAFINLSSFYSRFEWYIDMFNDAVLPLLFVSALSLFISEKLDVAGQLTMTPIIIGLFFIVRSMANRVNRSMAEWAAKAKNIGLFQITSGDQDAITKIAARSKNSTLKLIATSILSLLLNVIAGVICWNLLNSG